MPGEPNINVIFDACHMLKNIRNSLGEYRIFVDVDLPQGMPQDEVFREAKRPTVGLS